jgi:hypothetical protein
MNINIIILSSFLITGFLSPSTSPLEPMLHPHHPVFNFHVVALSLCAMPLVQLFIVENLLNLFLVLFPDTIIKGKVKVVPVLLTKHHAMNAYWGSGGIAPRIL